MNPKAQGEKGQRIVIGELAKFNLDVAIPLSDNLPFDLIVYRDGKLFRAQVKSGSTSSTGSSGSIEFNLRTSNWYKGTSKTYCKDDCDVMILCDYTNVYLLTCDDFSGRTSFTIRQRPSKQNQVKNCHSHEKYILSQQRIEEVFI